MNTLHVTGIKTSVFHVGIDLFSFVKQCILESVKDPKILEGKVLAITSKIVSLAENQLVPKDSISKEALVRKESDRFLGEILHGVFLTIKHGLFIPSAGIDESNSESGDYILFPKDPFQSSRKLCESLKKEFGLRHFGILMTDSHTTPLRAGVTGIALAYAGFKGVRSHIGAPDLFGRPLKMTRVNVADALAVAAVYCMGESDESMPLALIDAKVDFLKDNEPGDEAECIIPPEQDLYGPLYKPYLGS